MKPANDRPSAFSSIHTGQSAMTLTELLVLTILVLIAGCFVNAVFFSVSVKSKNTKALSNAKQIALGLRLYAEDHGGLFPSYIRENGKDTKVAVSDSNTAFAQLFPTYILSEVIFRVKDSAFCSTGFPDEITDKSPLDIPVDTLKKGENEWAYVVGLGASSNPDVPLIASGFANPVTHIYTHDRDQRGGVWKGMEAIVLCADSSGRILKVDQNTMTITGSNGADGMTGDVFTTANSANGWLTPANVVVNPK